MLSRTAEKHRSSRALAAAGLLMVVVAVTLGTSGQTIPVLASLGGDLARLGTTGDPSTPAGGRVGPSVPVEAPFPQLTEVADFERIVEKRPSRVPVEVHGLYLTGSTAGQTDRVDALLRELKGSSFNSFVIDVKNDAGRVSYRSTVPLAEAAGASTTWIEDPSALLARLRNEGIYTIARIVVFKDPAIARARPDLAVQSVDGGPWRDRTGAAWLDPHNREVWDYTVALAQEAAAKGFREVQFDYVRFPSDGDTAKIVYPAVEGSKAETIGGFLSYATDCLRSSDIYLSADIFGLVGSVTDDMGIGQHLEDILGNVDYISPMVYPSHYSARNYGLEDPESEPYQTVLAGLRDYQRRMAETPTRTKIRPWLQDFSLRVHYGEPEVIGQIQAARELGVNEFILWNPANVYNTAVFKKVTDLPSATAAGGQPSDSSSAGQVR